jgi:hypothetical protein
MLERNVTFETYSPSLILLLLFPPLDPFYDEEFKGGVTTMLPGALFCTWYVSPVFSSLTKAKIEIVLSLSVTESGF